MCFPFRDRSRQLMLKVLSLLSLSATSLAAKDDVEVLLEEILQQGIEDSTYPSVVGECTR